MANKAVFLDRDNTLIEDPGYINHPNQVRLLPGAAAALVQLRRMGYLLVVVTNQSAVARGIVTEEMLEKIHHRLNKLLADEGAYLDAIYYCPYHPEGSIPKYRMESDLRKPAPGMLLKAAEDLDIDLSRSWAIGDSYRDVAAGVQAGCRTILIDSPAARSARTASDPVPDRKVGSIREAANVIRMLEQTPPREAAPRADNEKPPADSPRPENCEVTIIEKNLLFSDKPNAAEAEAESVAAAVRIEEATATESAPEEAETVIEKPRVPMAESETEAPLSSAEDDDPVHTNTILREMLHLLKSRHRQDLYEEFSFARFLAMLIETVALFCLIASLWFWMDSSRPVASAQMMLGFAVFLQMTVIALLLIEKNR
jgi:D-glycero-D-manno-heptose 1,7-bisphosphate phosphatase